MQLYTPHISNTPQSNACHPARVHRYTGDCYAGARPEREHGASLFDNSGLTREAVPQLNDGPDVQHPVGFALQHRGGVDRFHLVAAAESSAGGAGSGAPSDEQAQGAELAKQLQNPIADLISVPIQNNWDFGIGPADAMRYTANIQPVIL